MDMECTCRIFLMGTPVYAVISSKITSATERAADEIISNRQVIRKVFCVMTPAPLWPVNVASRKGADNHRGFYS